MICIFHFPKSFLIHVYVGGVNLNLFGLPFSDSAHAKCSSERRFGVVRFLGDLLFGFLMAMCFYGHNLNLIGFFDKTLKKNLKIKLLNSVLPIHLCNSHI